MLKLIFAILKLVLVSAIAICIIPGFASVLTNSLTSLSSLAQTGHITGDPSIDRIANALPIKFVADGLAKFPAWVQEMYKTVPPKVAPLDAKLASMIPATAVTNTRRSSAGASPGYMKW